MKETFFKIIVPPAVHNELLQLSGKFDLGEYLRSEWISSIAIKDDKLYDELLKQVDEGESEAIVLTKEMHADLLLIDERKGTLIVRSLGIKTIGLLGVLLLSKEKKIISSVRPILNELISRTTFRIDKELYLNYLKKANEL